ncbi:hypothetical protein TIFTF001_022635 [Ficus carica]|uniref:Uncharacterized protein n=1 Tax=Ficus carica TaxID=3494 RepID=A0AA88AKB5_FICCA|nr:hypothetical protein TIFTF001_022635 [Ficus carica]
MGLNIALAILLVLVLVFSKQNNASRVLYDHEEGHKKSEKNKGLGLGFQTLPRGPVPPSGPSGCTYIPGGGGPNCPLGEKNYAGHSLFHDRNTYPRLMLQVGVATNQK